MKKLMILLVLAVVLTGAVAADVSSPSWGFHFVSTDSFAPVGFGAEFFFGPVGLTGQLTFLPIGTSGAFLFLYEPAVGARFYFEPSLDNTFYVGASAHYLSAFGGDSSGTSNIPFNIIRINAMVGFNALFGKNNDIRLAFELGPRYNIATASSTSDQTSWFMLHTQLMFGKIW